MKNGEKSKSYYLPPWRSITIGVILIIVGLAFTFMGVDVKNSFWNNLQWVLVSFEGVVEFLGSVIMLAFKLGFLLGGYFFVKSADRVERARLDNEGLYYREIPKGSGASKLAMDVGPLAFVPYRNIKEITLKKTFWAGWQLYLILDSGVQPLTALGVLKNSEKQEILDSVKQNIKA